MSDSPTKLRRLLGLPDPDARVEASNRWQELQDRLGREIKTIKWPAAMPNLVPKIGELFDQPLPDLLIAAWQKADALQTLLAESKNKPETVMSLELAEHSLTSKYHPYIEIKLGRALQVKRIDFTVTLLANLKGIILRIKNGTITGVQAGSCEFAGKVQYEDLTIAEKKVGPIQLGG
jgi:hypothetical protein